VGYENDEGSLFAMGVKKRRMVKYQCICEINNAEYIYMSMATHEHPTSVNNCCTISTIHVPSNDDMDSSELMDDVFATYNYMFDTFPSSKNDDMFTNEHTLEDNYYVAYDDTIPPIYDDYNDEYDIFRPPIIEEKISYDYNMHPIFDYYGDENNNDSYFVEFAPTTINKNDYAYAESSNYFMHVAHDKNVSCDSYIVNFIHDATQRYYERET
jgi:hypothetical protein